MILREYQKECAEAITFAWGRNVRRSLVILPTGAGKSVVFAYLIAKSLQQGRALVICHREEIIEQTLSVIRKMVPPSFTVGQITGKRKQMDADILVAGIQTVSRWEMLNRLRPTDFYQIIIDEAHHSCAQTYLRVLEYFEVLQGRGPFLVGFTATPERGDKQPLGKVFQDVVFYMPVEALIKSGYLCDVKGIQLKIPVELNNVPTKDCDFSPKALGSILLKANAPKMVAEGILQCAPTRKILAFTPSVEMAYAVAEEAREKGIPAQAVDNRTDKSTRQKLVSDFCNGQLQMLVNCSVFTEGFDAPATDCVVIARPTRSQTLYLQMLGRGMRMHEGKSDCLVIDVVGMSEYQQLQTLDKVLAIDSEELANQGFIAAERQAYPLTAKAVENLVARLRKIPQMVFKTQFAWVKKTNGFTLSIPHRFFTVSSWGAEWLAKSRYVNEPEKLLRRTVTLMEAVAACENYIKTSAHPNIMESVRQWRAERAYVLQIELLRDNWGLPVPDDMTKGTAADLIAIGKEQAARLLQRMPVAL